MKLKKHIFFIGFMGAGKTVISKLVGESLCQNPISIDKKIEESHNQTISEIFAQFGEEYFRNSETRILQTICKEPPAIIDCGGGIAKNAVNHDIIKKNGKTIWLQASPLTICERLKDDYTRPLLNNHITPQYIDEFLKTRQNSYALLADIVISTDGKTPNDICNEILERIKPYVIYN
ncbi:MAG: shikimate kinase [Eubacteriales bacterium]